MINYVTESKPEKIELHFAYVGRGKALCGAVSGHYVGCIQADLEEMARTSTFRDIRYDPCPKCLKHPNYTFWLLENLL